MSVSLNILFVLLLGFGIPRTTWAAEEGESCSQISRLTNSVAGTFQHRVVEPLQRIYRLLFPLKSTLDSGYGQIGEDSDYPSGSDAYQAHNKDTDNKSSVSPKAISVVNLQGAKLWAQTRYSHMDAQTGWLQTSGSRKRLDQNEKEDAEYLMEGDFPARRSLEYLILPEDLVPLRWSEHIEIFKDEWGNHFFRTKMKGQGQIELKRREAKALTKAEQARFTQGKKTPRQNWPEWLQNEISALHTRVKLGWSDKEVADRLARVIRHQMEYRVDSNDKLGVVEMAKDNGCQCDGAATLMTHLLRTEFGIAARVAGGFKGTYHEIDPRKSFLVAPSTGHAWVEVFDRETMKWHRFDPTPAKKDRETEDPDGGEDSPFKDMQDEGSQDPRDEDDGPSPKASPTPGNLPVDALNPEARALVNTVHAAWIHALEGIGNARSFHTRLDNLLTILGNQRLKENRGTAPVIEEYTRATSELKKWAMSLRSAHNRLEDLAPEAEKLTVNDVQGLRLVSTALSELALSRPLTDLENQLLSKVNAFVGDEPTQDTKLIGRAFFEMLPGKLSQETLLSKHGLSEPNDKFFHSLGKNFLSDDHRLLRLMSKTEGYLDLTPLQDRRGTQPQPPRVQMKTDTLRSALPVIGVARSIEDLPRAFVSGMPVQFEALKLLTGQLPVRDFEKPEPIRQPPKPEDDGRDGVRWVVIADLSGSMSGKRGRVRDSLGMGLIEKAYREGEEQDIPTDVFYINYRDEPEQPFELRTRDDASGFFKEHHKRGFVSNNGNDLAGGLARGFQVAREDSDTIRKVNFLILSDGDETIDIDRIREERDALDPAIEVAMNAITLVHGNADLKKIVEGKTDIKLVGRYHNIDEPTLATLDSGKQDLDIAKSVGASLDAQDQQVDARPSPKDLLRDLASWRKSLLHAEADETAIPLAVGPGTPSLSPLAQLPAIYGKDYTAAERRRLLKLYLDVASTTFRSSPDQIWRDTPSDTRHKVESWMGEGL